MDATNKVSLSVRMARLLAEGPRNSQQIQQELGITQDAFHSAIQQLRRSGMAEASTIVYSITERGTSYAKKVRKPPKTPAQRMSKSRDKAARVEAAHNAKIAKALESMVDCALASRPALQSVWGAMHA